MRFYLRTFPIFLAVLPAYSLSMSFVEITIRILASHPFGLSLLKHQDNFDQNLYSAILNCLPSKNNPSSNCSSLQELFEQDSSESAVVERQSNLNAFLRWLVRQSNRHCLQRIILIKKVIIFYLEFYGENLKAGYTYPSNGILLNANRIKSSFQENDYQLDLVDVLLQLSDIIFESYGRDKSLKIASTLFKQIEQDIEDLTGVTRFETLGPLCLILTVGFQMVDPNQLPTTLRVGDTELNLKAVIFKGLEDSEMLYVEPQDFSDFAARTAIEIYLLVYVNKSFSVHQRLILSGLFTRGSLISVLLLLVTVLLEYLQTMADEFPIEPPT